jgi:hypothetical protein
MRDGYSSPTGFEWDPNYVEYHPFVTDKRFTSYNADTKILAAKNYIELINEGYRGNHHMIPFGTDFAYSNAKPGFDNLDRFIEAFNSYPGNENITVMYSTPGQYLDALNNQTNVSWPVKYDDMFPYADNPEDYWSGYFTSRPGAKK